MGYASEATRAAMNYAFLTRQISQLISVIETRNAASHAIAGRPSEIRGERREIVFEGNALTVDARAISREEWSRRL